MPMKVERLHKLLSAAYTCLVIAVVPLALYSITPVPGALLARTIIDSWSNTETPLNFQSIVPAVTVMRDVSVPVNDAPGAKLDVYTPKQGSGLRPIILWIHGGSFVGGSKEDVQVYATLLANKGYVVASLEYTRPPDARYPVPVRQANATLLYLREHAATYAGDQTRVFVAGNSSGAQMASQVAAIETNPNLAAAMHLQPALSPGSLRGTLLYCGAYNMATLQNIRMPFLHVGLWSYTGYRNVTTFPDVDQLSTVKQLTSHYPPVFMTSGDADALRPQSLEFATALRQHGIPVTTNFWEGSHAKLGHDYQFKLNQPQAQETFQNTLTFLQTQSKE